MPNSINYVGQTSGNIITTNPDNIDGMITNPLLVGGMQLLSAQIITAGSASVVNFTSVMSASYNNYRLMVIPPSTGTGLTVAGLRFSANNGSTWDSTTGHYQYITTQRTVAGTTVTSVSAGSSSNSSIAFTVSSRMGIFDILNVNGSQITINGFLNLGAGFAQTVGIYNQSGVNALQYGATIGTPSVRGTYLLYGFLNA